MNLRSRKRNWTLLFNFFKKPSNTNNKLLKLIKNINNRQYNRLNIYAIDIPQQRKDENK